MRAKQDDSGSHRETEILMTNRLMQKMCTSGILISVRLKGVAFKEAEKMEGITRRIESCRVSELERILIMVFLKGMLYEPSLLHEPSLKPPNKPTSCSRRVAILSVDAQFPANYADQTMIRWKMEDELCLVTGMRESIHQTPR
jgi:hypothetical protein